MFSSALAFFFFLFLFLRCDVNFASRPSEWHGCAVSGHTSILKGSPLHYGDAWQRSWDWQHLGSSEFEFVLSPWDTFDPWSRCDRKPRHDAPTPRSTWYHIHSQISLRTSSDKTSSNMNRRTGESEDSPARFHTRPKIWPRIEQNFSDYRRTARL